MLPPEGIHNLASFATWSTNLVGLVQPDALCTSEYWVWLEQSHAVCIDGACCVLVKWRWLARLLRACVDNISPMP